MSDKSTMLRQAEDAFAELHQSFDGLTDEQMRRVWLGSWGVREILIHISGWHDATIAAFAIVSPPAFQFRVETLGSVWLAGQTLR